MLWLVYVTGAVAAGVLSRRLVPLPPESTSRSAEATSSCNSGTPQTVGHPIGQLPTGAVAATGAATSGGVSAGPDDGEFAAQGVAMGMPVDPAAGAKREKCVEVD